MGEGDKAEVGLAGQARRQRQQVRREIECRHLQSDAG